MHGPKKKEQAYAPLQLEELDEESQIDKEGIENVVAEDIGNTVESEAKGDDDGIVDLPLDDSSWVEKLICIVKRSVPVSIGFFLHFMTTFISLAFAGNYSLNVFAGLTLSNMFFNVTTLSLLVGMSGSVETLGSFHFGAGNFREVGLTFHRSMLILAVLAVFLLPILFKAGTVLRFIGMDDDICDVVDVYLRVRMLTLPMDVFEESFIKLCSCMGINSSTIVYGVLFNSTLLASNYLFIVYYEFEYVALAWTVVCATYISGICVFFFARGFPELQKTLIWMDMDVLKSVLEYDKCYEFIMLGIPGMAMLCSEWWAYEILTVLAGFIGTEAVAAQAILFQMVTLAFMLPLGMGVASCSIIGNSLGCGRLKLAKDTGKIALVTNSVMELFLGFLMYSYGSSFVAIFSEDEEVHSIVRDSLGFMSAFVFFDGLQCVASGILRGVGKQKIGAIMNIVAFYVIGIPLAYYFCFFLKHGVSGLLRGMFYGTLLQCTVLLYLLLWKEEELFVLTYDSATSAASAGIKGKEGKEIELPKMEIEKI